MKRLILLSCLGMWFSYASADNYKVLFEIGRASCRERV